MKSLFILLVCSAIGTALAQPPPKLSSLSREWVQRGTTAEIKVTGENLASAKRVIISGPPGVKAAVVPAAVSQVKVESSGGGISSVAPADSKSLKVKIEIAADASLMDREVRLVTDEGVSNPLTLRVGHLPEVRSESKKSREEAQDVPLPASLSGTIAGAAESHFYKFAAKKGEHVIFDVHAHRTGSKLDSSLAVFDTSGKELARDEDTVGLDSVLDFEAPSDGEYVVELRDFRFQGGGDFKYRLMAGVQPYVRQTFPFGGQRGTTVEVQISGANLQGTSKILLALAQDAELGRQEIRASTALGLSNPFPFDVSELRSVAENEPNSAIDQADTVSLPVAINGRINKAKDYDAFKFSAAKDQRIIFEVHAFRYGSPLDAVLILADRLGNVLQRNDDAIGSDAKLEYTFKDAGEYVLIVEDLLNRGGGEFAYRLTASVPQQDFAVTILPDTVRLRRGGRVPVRCEVNRMNGFAEPVQVFCEKLPRGVFAEPVVFAPGVSSGLMMLSAMEGAEIGSFGLKIKASAGETTKEAVPMSGDKAVQEGFITVLEEAPFSIASATLMETVEQNENGKIDLLVNRGGFDGEIRITPEGFSTGRDPITRSFEFQPLAIKPGQNRGTLSLRAKTDSEVNERHIVLRGEADVNGSTVAVFSPLVPVQTVQIPYVLTTSLKKLIVTALPSISESAASEAVFTVKADRRMKFEGEIELKLDGAPEGVSVELGEIPANGAEASVKLRASDKAPTGKEFKLTISGAGVHNDRTYRFNAPPVTLVINAPETEKEPTLANTVP